VIAAHQGLVQSLNGFEEEAGNMNGRKTFLIFGSSQKSMGRKIAKMIRKNINAFSERQKIALARKLGEITKESREPGVSDQNPEVEKERRKTLWEQLKNLKALVKSFIEQQGITSTKGVVYLTIDDSPSKDFREKVEFLLARGIPAIIFCIGSQLEMEARSEDVVYAIKNGFIIGNHSYGHPRFSKLSVEEARDQVLKTDKLIDGLYRKAGVKRQMKVFRFPYCDRGDGKCNSRGVSEDEKRHIAAIQQVLRANGYKHPRFNGVRYNGHIWPALFVDLHWTYDVRNDGHRPPPLKKTNNIVLIHDNYKAAEEFARELDRLVEAGLRFELPR
jgi:peptidoglycan/xylan/chitin deacetylase (PgdA/CDA1 family)